MEAEQYVGSSSVDRFDAALHAIADAIREVNAAGILIAEVSKAGLIAGAADLSAVRGSARLGLPVWPGRCWGSFATPIKSAMIRD